MTTYDGKGASYIAGREVVNKEPPVSKYVVEKLYRVHRERLMKVAPTIDSHVKIPEFLLNQTWKKNAERQKMVEVMRANRSIYNRLAKVENQESSIAKESKVHIKRVELKLSHLNKLKEHGRLVNLVKIQRENECLLRRIEKAKPEYSLKKCKEWYKYHEHYKNGRHSDHTGGHIMTGMKGLLPPALPPLASSLSTSSNRDSLESLISQSKKALPSIATMSQTGNSSLRSASNSSYMISSTSSYQISMGGKIRPKKVKQAAMPGFYDQKPVEDNPDRYSEEDEDEFRDEGMLDRIEEENPDEAYSAPATAQRLVSNRDLFQAKDVDENGSDDDKSRTSFMSQDANGDCDQHSLSAAHDDLMVLSSRPFAMPFDSKNCLVQVYSSRAYDENLYLKVVTSGLSTKVLAERALTIDKAYEVLNAGGHSSQIVHSTDNEDLQSLSTLLINMFKEADDDGSGSLTFDEFQALMEQVELGISPQELRFVISEADENENGVVDYDEFVPLAVDLIQSFRARNRAKALNSQTDVMIDDQIMKSISQEEVETAAVACLEKVFEFDSKRYGLIRVQDLKRCLHAVTNINISESEINMLCQMLPRDQFGRVKYNSTPTAFLETLSKVRFMAMKNALIESQGSGLQKYLLDLCREEEARLEHFEGNMEKFVPTGIVPCRSLISILSNSSRLSLSRLQVLVIMSEASVLDGMINYFQFIPVVAKAIEIMFEPKALRQRAELIEKTDLSPEALLQTMSTPEVFSQRLTTLFKSYDIDHNGKLDQNEFIACLESLDFQLTYDEMVNLMNNAADSDHRGYLEFVDFMSFFENNLLNLEREKRIRLLQSSMQSNKRTGNDVQVDGNLGTDENKADNDSSEQSLMDRLLGIFRLSDRENIGFITYDEFTNIMHNFSLHSSNFLMDVLLSELRVNDNGMVDYMKSITTCADLLKVFKAKESAVEQHKEKESWAEEKAMHILQASASDLNHIVRSIRHKLKKLAEKPVDALTRFMDIQEGIRSPQSGLSRNEANMVISKLFYSMAREMGSDNSPPKPIASTAWSSFIWSNRTEGASSPSNQSAKTPNTFKSSQQFKESLKSIKYQFSSEEIFDAVFEARKVTIMRSLLQETDKTATQQMLIKILEAELSEKQNKNEISPDSNYLPVKNCFNILENCEELRLNRAQVMFIVSWAECFDRDGLALEIHRFAEHAAIIIEKLHVPEVLETRANVINQATIDDKKALNGLKEKDLIHYLENDMKKYVDEDGYLPSSSLKDVLKDLPRLKLSEREVATIVAGLPLSDDTVNGSEIVMPCVNLIRSLCRERTINRRVSLIVTANMPDMNSVVSSETKKIQEDSMNELKQLAEKLLNFVKINMQGENMIISLPTDVLQRRSSTMVEENYNAAHHNNTLLYKGGKLLPMHTIITTVGVAPAPNTPPHQREKDGSKENASNTLVGRKHTSRDFTPLVNTNKPIVHIETVESQEAVFLQVLLVKDTRLFSGSSMIVNVTFLDGRMITVDNLPIKMFSAGLVDEEAAQQYVSNLVETFYLEKVQNQEIALRIKDV